MAKKTQKPIDLNRRLCYTMYSCAEQQFNQLRKATFIMATEKLFTVAGTATNADGTVKVRFANDLVARIKILNKNNCTNINLVELPKAMTKMEALQHLQTLGITAGDAGFAVANKLAEKAKVAKKGEVKIKATKVVTESKTPATQEATA